MPKLFILVLSGTLFTLCAKGDSIHVTSADRSSGTYLSFESERGLRGDFAQFSPSKLIVQTGFRSSELPGNTGFSPSKLVWNLNPSDVTEFADETLPGAWNGRAVSSWDDKGHVINTAPVTVPQDVTPIPEPETLGLIAVALAAIALMRGKRLA